MATTNAIAEWALGRVGDVKQLKMFKYGTKYLSMNEEQKQELKSKLGTYEKRFISFVQ